MATEIATELDLVPQFCRYAFGAKRTKVKGQRSNSQGQNQFWLAATLLAEVKASTSIGPQLGKVHF